MMRLQWRLAPPVITTQWRGPDDRLAPSALVVPAAAIPTLIGPPGPPGPAGPTADIIDGGTFF
jgi:hypothetical protein